MNINKTKVMMMTQTQRERKSQEGKWPCGICCKGVGANSIQCSKCLKWIHKKCCGIKGKLGSQNTNCICPKCKDKQHAHDERDHSEKEMDIGDGCKLEIVSNFRYLGDVLADEGGAELAIIARIKSAWGKFWELKSILRSKKISLKVKGQMYASCVRSCMIYGSETWALKKDSETKIQRTENKMLRLMCNVRLKDRVSSEELRKRIGVEPIKDVLVRNRLRWLGHVERRDNENWVKKSFNMEVQGKGRAGRPRKSWKEVVTADMRSCGLKLTDAQDRVKWRLAIGRKRPTQCIL